MPNLRLRLTSVAALSAILLSSCSVIGGGGGKETKLTAWFPKTIALFKDSQVRVLGLPAAMCQAPRPRRHQPCARLCR